MAQTVQSYIHFSEVSPSVFDGTYSQESVHKITAQITEVHNVLYIRLPLRLAWKILLVHSAVDGMLWGGGHGVGGLSCPVLYSLH